MLAYVCKTILIMGPVSKTSRLLIPILLAVSLCACGQVSSTNEANNLSADAGNPQIVIPPDSVYKPESLLWEGQNPDSVLWSAILYRALGVNDQSALLTGSDDILDFCPKFDSLTDMQKINFWAFLLSGISKFESGFNPIHRRAERAGVFKEGLLQLSYELNGQFRRCMFDEVRDGQMSSADPRRSILNPVTQMACAVDVLTNQIETQKRIAHNGSYWRALRLNTPFSAVNEIKAFSQQLPFCN